MAALGINCMAHDTSAALTVDGQLVAAAEEERLNREKHTWEFPDRAVTWCLRSAGLTMRDVDVVAFDYRPGLEYLRALWFDILPRLPASSGYLRFWSRVEWQRVQKIRSFRRRWQYTGRIELVDHHRAHAASSYLCSPFEDAVALVIDRAGDSLSTAAYRCSGTRLERLMHVRLPHSLGELYSGVTWWLGFQPGSDEGKVMALASYGDDSCGEDFRALVRPGPGGEFRLDTTWMGRHRENGWVSARFIERYGPRRDPAEPIADRHRAVAHAVQQVTEDTALHMARHLGDGSTRNLCLAGGVCLNSVMNTRVLLEGPFERLFVPPAPGDAGNAVGAALAAAHRQSPAPRFRMEHAYWGPEFSAAEIEAALEAGGHAYYRTADPSLEAARLLAGGSIVGWFQGAMEFGPRALGNRSILADPRVASAKDRINRLVKHREPFRPFAPAVLEDHVEDWFEPALASPFMLLVLPVREERRSEVPAIVHVDGTGRLQTVRPETNERFSRLIGRFCELTGVPMVLNTSFNDRNEPIVCSPADALRSLRTTQLDVCVIGPYVVRACDPRAETAGGVDRPQR